jgi:prepilin-type N-terminal cleavage/methylation domain-containing protein
MSKKIKTRRKYFITDKRGFSLLELIVATGIFLTIATLGLGIYTQLLKSQRVSLIKLQIQRESQLILETLTKKIRTSVVDYSQYPPGFVNPQATLYLIDPVGDTYAFQSNASDELEVSYNSGAFRKFNAQSVRITSLDFFIEPTSNPFINLGEKPSEQPRVTISTVFASADVVAPSSVLVELLVPQRASAF